MTKVGLPSFRVSSSVSSITVTREFPLGHAFMHPQSGWWQLKPPEISILGYASVESKSDFQSLVDTE